MQQVNGAQPERRRHQRRQASVFRWHENRSGFENRRPPRVAGPGAIFAWPGYLARAMRGDPGLLLKILLMFNLYNIADYILTINALAAGYQELNPVMRSLFAHGLLSAGIFKIVTGLAVTGLIWRYRRYMLVLQLSLYIFGLYLAVVAYHILGVVLADVLF